MFVYNGLFDYGEYASQNQFVLILPYGPARIDDPVYIFWSLSKSKNDSGVGGQFQKAIVEKSQTTETGDDFTFGNSSYSFKVHASHAYDSLNVDIKPSEGTNSAAVLSLSYQQATIDIGPGTKPYPCIWTGKLKWYDYAKDVPIIVVLPHGLVSNEPVLLLWQWTRDAGGRRSLSSISASQTPVDGNRLVFETPGSYYSFKCTIDKDSYNLSAVMRNPAGNTQKQDDWSLILGPSKDTAKIQEGPSAQWTLI